MSSNRIYNPDYSKFNLDNIDPNYIRININLFNRRFQIIEKSNLDRFGTFNRINFDFSRIVFAKSTKDCFDTKR